MNQFLAVWKLSKRTTCCLEGSEDEAVSDDQLRAYGGIIRTAKGKLVESIVKHLIRIAWKELGQDDNRLSINKVKTYKIQVKHDYVQRLKDEEVRNYILNNLERYFY